jgi:hypothetical protein
VETPNNQRLAGAKLERELLRAQPFEWVLAKYCLDNGVVRLTVGDIKLVLGSRNPFALYRSIRAAVKDGLLVRKGKGLYEVNREAALRVLQLIPGEMGNRMNQGLVPQWKEAAEIAEAWLKLRDWALQHSSDGSDGTSPLGQEQASPLGASGAAAAGPARAPDLPPGAKYFPIERVPTPNGMYAWAAVLGSRYVLLEGIESRGWGRAYCISYELRPGAKLCSQRLGTLLKYTSIPYYMWSRRQANGRATGGVEGSAGSDGGGGPGTQGSAVSAARADPSPSGVRPGADGEGGGAAVKTYNIKARLNDDGSVVIEGELPELEASLKGNVIPLIRRVDPLRPPEGQPPLSVVFDNVRYWDGAEVRQLHGLKGIDTVFLLGRGLVYAEPGFQIADRLLYELSKLMDIHIYHSKGKDPRGVVRVEARPRARALRKLGLPRVLQLFATYLHRLSMAFAALASAWSSFKYAG